MIKLVHGSKGSGKTKRIIKCANDEITTAKGEHVYITDNLMHTIDIDRWIRFVNILDYGIKTTEAFIGFLKGMTAANSDITKVYIDGINRFLVPANECGELLAEFEKISLSQKIVFTLTISTDKLPEFLLKYV